MVLPIFDNLQLYLAETTVPIISDVASVHYLTKEVLQVLPWHPVVVLQVVIKDIARDDKVSCVVRVGLVPALWTKLFALRDNGMEIAKGE